MDYDKLTATMRTPKVFDTRNCIMGTFEKTEIVNFGNLYEQKEEKVALV